MFVKSVLPEDNLSYKETLGIFFLINLLFSYDDVQIVHDS